MSLRRVEVTRAEECEFRERKSDARAMANSWRFILGGPSDRQKRSGIFRGEKSLAGWS